MGDDKAGPVAHQPLECLLNESLRGGVDAGRGLVEDQDGSVFQKSSCDANALLLAHAQPDAPLTDPSIKPVGKASNELRGVGRLGGRDEFRFGGIEATVENIFADRAIEEEGLLADDGDLGA